EPGLHVPPARRRPCAGRASGCRRAGGLGLVIQAAARPRTDLVEPSALDSAGDADLVAAISAARPEALEAAYRRHSTAVLGVARRVLRAGSLAEEGGQGGVLGPW